LGEPEATFFLLDEPEAVSDEPVTAWEAELDAASDEPVTAAIAELEAAAELEATAPDGRFMMWLCKEIPGAFPISPRSL
jgi:hypothetical protein